MKNGRLCEGIWKNGEKFEKIKCRKMTLLDRIRSKLNV